jgi:hypothetical protein
MSKSRSWMWGPHEKCLRGLRTCCIEWRGTPVEIPSWGGQWQDGQTSWNEQKVGLRKTASGWKIPARGIFILDDKQFQPIIKRRTLRQHTRDPGDGHIRRTSILVSGFEDLIWRSVCRSHQGREDVAAASCSLSLFAIAAVASVVRVAVRQNIFSFCVTRIRDRKKKVFSSAISNFLFVSQVSFAIGEVLFKYRQLLATWSMLASFLEEPSCFFFLLLVLVLVFSF